MNDSPHFIIEVCPQCGLDLDGPISNLICCPNCSLKSTWRSWAWDWRDAGEGSSAAFDPNTGGRSLRTKLQDAISSGKFAERLSTKVRQIIAPLRPYRLLTAYWARRARKLTEAYYEQILKPNETSRFWANRYLTGLDLPSKFAALEIGCGRGANLCHLQNIGADVSGHDIVPQAWWSKLANARLQVIQPNHQFLPWRSGVFDFVLIMQVAAFFDEPSYRFLAREIHRVLRPGGYVVMQETNPNSYAIAHHRKYYGREPHSLSLGRNVFAAEFEEMDHWYEGYYARHFPMIRSLRRTANHAAPGPWMIHDGSDTALPPERRVLWVLRARKPL